MALRNDAATLAAFVWVTLGVSPTHSEEFASPRFVNGVAIGVVAAGSEFTCGVLESGGVRCWGRNDVGQLGNENQIISATPGSRTQLAVRSITSAIAVTAGGAHACALLSSGGVRCWGRNSNGQLGDGTTNNSFVPTTIASLGTLTAQASAVSAGDQHTCAIVQNPVSLSPPSVRCWGSNAYGQLGRGTTGGDFSTPAVVPGTSGAIAVAAGGRHSCAVLATRAVVCWGFNGNGQLGDGTTTQRNTATTAVTGINTAWVVTAGQAHSCAGLQGGGPFQCWGDNGLGRLGNGGLTPPQSLTPVSVVTPPTQWTVEQIAAGADFACGIAHSPQGRDVYCWGGNSAGQLGAGDFASNPTPRIAPVPRSGSPLDNPEVITAGKDHACALIRFSTSQRIVCWGANTYGQVGNDALKNSATPVTIAPMKCSLDIDSDGTIGLGTDWLLLARARMGLSGDAVLSDALGANAVRKTWPDIRSYLETSCAMTNLAE